MQKAWPTFAFGFNVRRKQTNSPGWLAELMEGSSGNCKQAQLKMWAPYKLE